MTAMGNVGETTRTISPLIGIESGAAAPAPIGAAFT